MLRAERWVVVAEFEGSALDRERIFDAVGDAVFAEFGESGNVWSKSVGPHTPDCPAGAEVITVECECWGDPKVPHDHRQHVDGCFRCDLSRDEVSE